jgi:hypothetical protein
LTDYDVEDVRAVEEGEARAAFQTKWKGSSFGVSLSHLVIAGDLEWLNLDLDPGWEGTPRAGS